MKNMKKRAATPHNVSRRITVRSATPLVLSEPLCLAPRMTAPPRMRCSLLFHGESLCKTEQKERDSGLRPNGKYRVQYSSSKVFPTWISSRA